MVISKDLHLDVPWIFDVLFNKHASIPERALGLAAGAHKRVFQLLRCWCRWGENNTTKHMAYLSARRASRDRPRPWQP